MRSMFPRSVAARLAWWGCASLVVVLGALAQLAGNLLEGWQRSEVQQHIADKARGVAGALDAIDLASSTMVERVFPVFRSMLGGDLRLDESSRRLMGGDKALGEGSEAVDAFMAQTGGIATVFERRDQDYVRISTSLRKQDGQRALGTVLDTRGAPYAAVSRGEPFAGRALLFGQWYMTRYEPVKDRAGSIVGVLFIGFPIGVMDAAVENVVGRTRLYDSGGLYLVDPKGGAAEARLAMHATAKGRKLSELVPDAAQLLDALGKSPGARVPSPPVLASSGDDRWAVMVPTASGLWVVAEVSEGEAMAHARQAQWVLWGVIATLSLALAGGLLWLSRRLVGRPLARLAASARAVAAGDLSSSCASDRADDVGQLMRDVEAMRTSFVDLLGELRSSSDSIATASREIAGGNADLSQRTETTASNLQQAASSIEQLTAAVRSTADSAKEASQVAGSASGAAHDGGTMMKQVVGNMKDIEASAQRIGEISGVIDGIAFQTNILALNAAVEAARAGEAGRGFAVVATEVRSLAQRSAAAAREIKGLIDGSVERVAVGAQLVQSAESAIVNMVDQVRQVDALIAAISAQAAEQSSNLAHVNQTVSQLDSMTQQNAALVEQSAGAAASLQDQVQRLSQSMQRFEV